jgi:hypothetical protein
MNLGTGGSYKKKVIPMPAKRITKKGKKPSPAALTKVKEFRLGGKPKAKADVEGQGLYAVACWYDGAVNIVPSNWATFGCWHDGCVNTNPFYGYP